MVIKRERSLGWEWGVKGAFLMGWGGWGWGGEGFVKISA